MDDLDKKETIGGNLPREVVLVSFSNQISCYVISTIDNDILRNVGYLLYAKMKKQEREREKY